MYDITTILRLREAGAVTRWHTAPLANKETVGNHSFGVAMLVILLVENPSANLIKAALVHDMAERWVGDMPSPVKWTYPELYKEYCKGEDETLAQLQLDFPLTKEERSLVNQMDYLDAGLFGYERWLQGDSYGLHVFRRIHKKLASMEDLDPAVAKMISYIAENTSIHREPYHYE